MKKITVFLLIVIQIMLVGCTSQAEQIQEEVIISITNIISETLTPTKQKEVNTATPTITNSIEKEEKFNLSVSFNGKSKFINQLNLTHDYFSGEPLECENQLNITKFNNDYYYFKRSFIYDK